jgi:hypothetical protein
MGAIKQMVLEIIEMDQAGLPFQQIADMSGLSVEAVLSLLDQYSNQEPYWYADQAADLDAEFYGKA